MQELRVALMAPLGIEPHYRTQIQEACPNTVLYSLDETRDIEDFDGQEMDVLVCEIPPRHLAKWPKLRLIQLVSAGVDFLQGHPIWQSGISIATARGAHSVPIAEHVTAMLLMLVHRLPETIRFSDTWTWPDRDALAGDYLRGKTVGILGYGGIGAECGRQLHALGMRVLAMNQLGQRHQADLPRCWPGTGDSNGQLPERFFSSNELSAMLPQCDALVVTAAKANSTIDLLGTAELVLLPRGARIIIASRGGIVNEEALAEALRSGQIAGAAVDAFTEEPPPHDHPLRGAPNLIATPHMSGVFCDFWSKICNILGENLCRLSRNESLVNLTNPISKKESTL